ncbi:MAG: exodeoxyribonuclease V subunit gamma [Oscillospiraceae bacterium]|nr:exodeoxyribonuclease V subunit gamma [Oscillospiraceae bacterium]
MFHFILGECGTGKSTELMHRIRKDLEQNKQVIMIVPEQFSFEAEKRLYDFLDVRLFNQMKTYSFYTLSQDILLKCGSSGRNYASEQEKLLFLYQAVQECIRKDALKILYRQNTPDSLMQLQKLVAKMRKEGITAEKMHEISPVFTDSVQLRDKTKDLSEILSAYDRILQAHGLCDNLNDLTGAALLAQEHDFFRNQHVYLDEFGAFSGDQYQMLSVIMEQAEDFSIAIRDTQEQENMIFRNGHQTFLNLKQKAEEKHPNAVKIQYCKKYMRSGYADLKAVASQIFRSDVSQSPYENHVHVFQAEDAVSEAEYICAEIYHLLSADPSLHYRDIAIAVKEPSVYRPLLERAFARYQLPYDIAAEKSVIHTELIRYFLTLLEILASKNWNTDMILKYLKNSFSGCDGETVAMLEHFCFTWSIDKEDWTKKFYEENQTELNRRSEPFDGQKLEILRNAFITEMQNLKTACQNADVRKICRTVYTYLVQKKNACDETKEEVLKQNESATLWKMLGETMDTVVRNMGAEILSLSEIYQLFLMLLKNSSFSTPPETLDSIRVIETLYEVLTVRLNSPAAVFVPGVMNGTFPSEMHTQGVFTEKELRELEEYHIRIAHLLPELYSDELLIINKILAAPTKQLYLTYPAVNAEHEPAEPSVVIGEILRMFPPEAPVLHRQEEFSPDYYAWTKQAAYFHLVRNLHRDDAKTASVRAVLEADPVYASRIRKLTEKLPEQCGHTEPAAMKSLLGSQLKLSPTGIETFYTCPFQYFCRYCLKMYAPEKITLTPNHIGNFAHYCLEKILGSHPEDFTELSEDQLIQEIEELAEVFKKENFSASVLKNSRFKLSYHINTQSVLRLLKHLQTELKKSVFVPAAFEERLGPQEDLKPYSLRNGEILCQGKIDRVDLCDAEDRRLMRVIDYKTGTKYFSPEKLAYGLDMQMLIYLFALEQNQAFGAEPAGVLYLPSGQPIKSDYQDRTKKPVSREEFFQDFYQMKGLLLEDVLPYMQEEAPSPASVMNHTDTQNLFSATSQQFSSLKKHVERKICEMADRLYEGDTAPKPYLYQKNSPCNYCRYADICGHADLKKMTLTKKLKQEALKTVFEQEEDLTEQEEHKDEMD